MFKIYKGKIKKELLEYIICYIKIIEIKKL